MKSMLTVALLFVALTFVEGAEVAFSHDHIKVRGHFSQTLTKLKKDRQLRIAFLGGSITQNQKGHSGMVPKLLRELSPGADVQALNAGLSSTCSTSGAFRLKSHVLDSGPVDLFIVEFAVNDDQDAAHASRECLRGMEGIIRQMRTLSPQTEIVMVHYLNTDIMETIQKGDVPVTIAAHEKVAEHYGVSTVSVAAEVALAIKGGKYTWKDYGGVHPKSFGYEIASRMIVSAITAGWERSDSPRDRKLPKQLDAGNYAGGEFVPVGNATTSGEWKTGKPTRELLPIGGLRTQYSDYDLLRGEKIGDMLKLEFEGTAIGAFVLAGPDAGMVATRMDGGTFVEHDLYHRYSKGLNYPRSVMFHTDLKPGKHTLDLVVSDNANPASKGHAVNILFFEVNR